MEGGIKNQKNISTDFKEAFLLILKKWTSFRLALDHNPKVLAQFTDEEETTLEVDAMIDILFDDISKEFKKNAKVTKFAIENVGEMLFSFIEDFFRVELQDGSEEQVATSLLKAYNELAEGKKDFLERLRSNATRDSNANNFNISFPISAEDKIKPVIKNMNQKMNIDSDEMDVDEEEEDEDEEEDKDQDEDRNQNTNKNTNQNENILNRNVKPNSNATKNNSEKGVDADEEGFVVVKKGKKY